MHVLFLSPIPEGERKAFSDTGGSPRRSPSLQDRTPSEGKESGSGGFRVEGLWFQEVQKEKTVETTITKTSGVEVSGLEDVVGRSLIRVTGVTTWLMRVVSIVAESPGPAR